MSQPHADEPALTVADLMVERVRTISAETSLRDAHSRMRLGRFRHLPVVDDAGRLVGIVSDRDILQAWSRGPERAIAEVMNRYTRAVNAQTPAIKAANQMLHDKIGSLPVVDNHQRVIGIVTETDFLVLARRALLIYQHCYGGGASSN